MQSSSQRIGKSPAPSDAHMPLGTPAPYGHACTNCAKAKCKCIHRDGGGACERCFRLKKDCNPSVPNRKRNPRKTPSSRTAHLEEKLDDLVSLIRLQTNIRAPGKANSPSTRPETHGLGGPPTVPSLSSVSTPNESPAGPASGETYATDVTSPSSTGVGFEYDCPIADDVAESNLALFRRDMVRFCPIVYLPPSLTAKELRRTHPFLWLSIMACASCSMKEAYALGDKLRQAVATKVVIDLDRNLDLLQSLLVFMQWPHSHRTDKPWLSLWTNMGLAMAQDLGFMSVHGETAYTYVKKFWLPKSQNKNCHGQSNTARTMEERRTVLAFYVWTSMSSQMVRRENAIRWTPFMEQNLRAIIETPEWEGDSILATQVRCALVGQQMTDLAIQQAYRAGESRIPMYFHNSLSAQLEDIWRTLPANLVQNEAVLLSLYGAEVAVHDLASNFDPSLDNVDIIKRLDALQKCLKAVENFFQTWDRIPTQQHMGLTLTTFIQLLHVIVALFRLSTLDSIPGWDPAVARGRLHLFALLDHLAKQMEMTIATIPILEDDEEASTWSKAAKVMRLIKQGIKRDFPNLDPLGSTGIEQVSAMAAGGADLQGSSQEIQDAFLTNFGDDPWLSAIFIPWDSMNF
ncbi:hypothetical protein M406DRAFT_109448 [Cryphonectria parasitica EP155]|uniref:Zn(2)-C6 fungal-type domain-containing protein n=1 Tax=Cryphonectria parasitica (strain ATCC 38755 / EP155) TaxID=660469 RepID=A0A9P4XT37_CRYP1|nr:uncharacterized protein M406DRAFT_109448 [Cryphonectria parasitica EP155]KAF3760361.1 hypothetical protein M406DRAFT_109448 [Cryphonectria parasitica EP155]